LLILIQEESDLMSEEIRKAVDCRLYPSEKGCTLRIEGTEEEVLEAAIQHAVTAHGHTNSPELREQLRGLLKDASA
jgi:predicted small metal-binding protein